GSVGVVGLVGSVGLLLVGGFVEDGGRVDDGGFVDVDVGSPGSPVPLGPSDVRAAPLAAGVWSSDGPKVPSVPGPVGRLVAVPVSPSWPARSAPRLSSSTPWLAEGFTPTFSDGVPASLPDVAPRVTTVPSTATSRAPAPVATRLRRARPFRPPPAFAGDGEATVGVVPVRWITRAVSAGGRSSGKAAGAPRGGAAGSSGRTSGSTSASGGRAIGMPER